MAPGRAQWDLGVGIDDQTGWEARARAAVGLAPNVEAFGEAFVRQQPGGAPELGALAGIQGRF